MFGGGGGGGKSIATGLGREPVGGCYSAEMRRPAIRSTAHDPILSYPTYQPPIQDVSLQISVPNCVPLRGYTIRRSRDRLIFNMGIPISRKDGLYIETGPRFRKCDREWS